MRILVALCLILSSSFALRASTALTCTAPGYSSTSPTACGFADGSLAVMGFDKATLSGNTLTIQTEAFVQTYDPALSSIVPKTVTAHWSEGLSIPANPNSDDVLKITYDTFGIFQNVLFSVGSWSRNEPCFDAHFGCFGPLPRTPQATLALPRSSGGVEMADSGTYLLQVEFAHDPGVITGGCNCGGDSSTLIVSRFLADGITPDPFSTTPEPSSAALGMAGVTAAGLAVAFHRKRSEGLARRHNL